MNIDLSSTLRAFQISGTCTEISTLKVGHIHETYVSHWQDGPEIRRYVHQKLNQYVFPDIEGVMVNIELVTAHIRSKLTPEDSYRTLEIVPTLEQKTYHKDEQGECWRTFRFVEGTKGYEACPSAAIAYQSGVVCGRFAEAVSDLDHTKLKVTIPNFINSIFRYEQFRDALKSNAADRLKYCKPEIDFAIAQEKNASLLMNALARKTVPYRVSHNDTKIDNILFDEKSEEGVCIVDLDTCMAGSPLFDYGDLMRTSALLAPEDEQDMSNIYVVDEFYKAVHEGFLAGCRDFLTEKEHELLPKMPAIVSLTLGLRFLTDFLNGDVYFKIDHELHNHQRARAQFEVTRQLEAV